VTAAGRIDWAQAHERLDRAQRALAEGMERSPEQAQRLLLERAQALARPLDDGAETAAELLDVVVFSVAGDRYGVEAHHVVEVLGLSELTRLPCTPAFVLGIVNHRGRVLPIFDLPQLLGSVSGAESGVERTAIVAVDVDGVTFAIAADAIEETARHAARALAVAPGGELSGPIRGVTGGLLTVLDLEALAADPRLHIDDAA
jgi:purine-binding chemotaxis protein CheW